MQRIHSAPELFAHAIAIERQAAQRYGELAARMQDLGQEAVAEVLAALAQFEAEHLQALERRTTGWNLPAIAPEEHLWLDTGSMLTSRQVLGIALQAECRAQAFFENVCLTAEDPALRELAREMALEEGEHIALIERLQE